VIERSTIFTARTWPCLSNAYT